MSEEIEKKRQETIERGRAGETTNLYIEHPLVVGMTFTRESKSKLKTVIKMDGKQEKVLKKSSEALEKMTEAVDGIATLVPTKDNKALTQKLMDLRENFDQKLKEYRDSITLATKNQQNIGATHQDLMKSTEKTIKTLNQGIHRLLLMENLKSQIIEAAKLFPICVDRKKEEPLVSALLKVKIKEFRVFCLDFIIPLGTITNQAYLCKECWAIMFISTCSFNATANRDLILIKLSDLFTPNGRISIKSMLEEFVKAVNLDLEYDKEQIETLELPEIRFPGKSDDRNKHSCRQSSAQLLASKAEKKVPTTDYAIPEKEQSLSEDLPHPETQMPGESEARRKQNKKEKVNLSKKSVFSTKRALQKEIIHYKIDSKKRYKEISTQLNLNFNALIFEFDDGAAPLRVGFHNVHKVLGEYDKPSPKKSPN